MLKLVDEISKIVKKYSTQATLEVIKFNISDNFIREVWFERRSIGGSTDENGDVNSMWTRKFVPEKYDKPVARELGLAIYEYSEGTCLVLPGSIQDSYPLIDAYQAIIDGSIPSLSLFFTNRKSFKDILGCRLFDCVKKAITIEEPIIQIKIIKE